VPELVLAASVATSLVVLLTAIAPAALMPSAPPVVIFAAPSVMPAPLVR